MKVGIITFHWADNQGAVLQALALCEFLKSTDYEPYVIDHNPALCRNGSLIKKIIKYSLGVLAGDAQKHRNFDNFRRKYFNFAESYDVDALITGSDQVWNPYITNFDSAYFLDFKKLNQKTISYAASLGQDALNEEIVNYLTKNLTNIDFISVRESGIINTLEHLTHKKITHTLDPVFLPNYFFWEQLIEKEETLNYKYVLVYKMSYNDDMLLLAKHIAKMMGAKVIVIPMYARPDKDLDVIKMYAVPPPRFLRLIQHAEYIVTDSFHGTAFSIIFNKYFVSFLPLNGRTGRITDLLKIFKLEERICTAFDEFSKIPFETDYSSSTVYIDNMKNISKEFLIDALK